MSSVPEPLPSNANIGRFTPDVTLSWVIAYAGPCGDPECQQDGEAGGHYRLYLVPLIGWIETAIPSGTDTFEQVVYRPAVMSSSGIVADYLDLGSGFKLVGVLRVTEDVTEIALGMFKEKFGDAELIVESKTSRQAVN